jgi:hypothetical protein
MKWWGWDSEEILQENDVEVNWSDKMIDGEGTVSTCPWGGSWALIWKHGVIDLGSIGKEYEASRGSHFRHSMAQRCTRPHG